MRILPFALIASLLCYSLPVAHNTNSTQHAQAAALKPTLNQLIDRHAQRKQIPSKLLHALIKQESNYNPNATKFEPHLNSSSMGLMQIMANYWTRSSTCPQIKHSSDLLNPNLNLDCGTSILSALLKKYPTQKDALIAYNGGTQCFKNPKCLASATAYAKKILN